MNGIMDQSEDTRTLPDNQLSYTIHSCSSHQPPYVPENILENKYGDQNSRWSSVCNAPQYIILKLQNTSIVKYITFGNYEQPHVCNLKSFKVYGGLEDDTKIELLSGDISNDCSMETFDLLQTFEDNSRIPIRYIKIEPLESWGSSVSYSVWYVKLHGTDDPLVVSNEITKFYKYRENKLIRLCLKHFRKTRYEFASVLLQNSVSLEHPFLSDLYNTIVSDGNYDMAEHLMDQALDAGFLEDYLNNQSYKPIWKLVKENDSVKNKRPCMRGGHQMCIDSDSGMIYLLGGWDGVKDLSDLWSFNISTGSWHCIEPNVELHGGPSPRSCHKICIDEERRQIYVLGRFSELSSIQLWDSEIQSDFYVYDIDLNKWTLICADTSAMNGPKLLFGHQMIMDLISSTIYVFGGRVITHSRDFGVCRPGEAPPSKAHPVFSGFYKYHVPTNKWTCILPDTCSAVVDINGFIIQSVASRGGHSILLHSKMRRIYIYGGQKRSWSTQCPAFLWYDIETGLTHTVPLNRKLPMVNTQRATIDTDHDEIYVLSSLSKVKDPKEDKVHNAFWVYSIKQNKWKCIYKSQNSDVQYWNDTQHLEPCPRFAYQLIYDQKNKTHYLFGGNPGKSDALHVRLDDFWELKINRCSNEKISRQYKLLIRKFKFQEIKNSDKVNAMQFLQTFISELIDHSDIEQTQEFQATAALLFNDNSESCNTEQQNHELRYKLFENLCDFFEKSMVQPKENLANLIPL